MLRYIATERKTQGKEEYGIAMLKAEQVIDQLEDVASDKGKIIALCDRLNQNDVAEIHFRDIVEDYVNELTSA